MSSLAGERFPLASSLELTHSDYWSEDTSVDFYHQTLLVDAQLGLKGKVAHETHRNRSFFHPFFTDRILQRVPEIRLTGDLSHWICVCERLLDVSSEDVEVMDRLLPKVSIVRASYGRSSSHILGIPYTCSDRYHPKHTVSRSYRCWVRAGKTVFRRHLEEDH